MPNPIKILHCPKIVAGHAAGIARAERRAGLDSQCVVLADNGVGYAADRFLTPPGASRVAVEFKRFKLLRLARQADLVHFNFGHSIMPGFMPRQPPNEAGAVSPFVWTLYRAYANLLGMRDVAWLKRKGVKIAVTYQGDDARQADFCRANFAIHPADEVPDGYYTDATDALKRRAIAVMDRHADLIFAQNPDLMHVLPERTRFLPYAHIDLNQWKPTAASSSGEDRPLRIVHAPSHRGVKGTRFILDAVERLRRDPELNFEFDLIENVPFQQIRERYERADLLVDQLLCGWYGSVAVEFMALGKPVVSFIREGDLKFIPGEMRRALPVVNANPETVFDVLKKCLKMRSSQIFEIGCAGRGYVEKWHDQDKSAQRLKALYESLLARESVPPTRGVWHG